MFTRKHTRRKNDLKREDAQEWIVTNPRETGATALTDMQKDIITEKLQNALRKFNIHATATLALSATLNIQNFEDIEHLEGTEEKTVLKIDIRGTDLLAEKRTAFIDLILKSLFGENYTYTNGMSENFITLTVLNHYSEFLETLKESYFTELYKQKTGKWENNEVSEPSILLQTTQSTTASTKPIDKKSTAAAAVKTNGVYSDEDERKSEENESKNGTVGRDDRAKPSSDKEIFEGDNDKTLDAFGVNNNAEEHISEEAGSKALTNHETHEISVGNLNSETEVAYLEHYRKATINALKKAYPWRPSVFGHHHGGRCAAVCKAIDNAQSVEDVYAVLDNQLNLILNLTNKLENYTSSRVAVSPVNNQLLKEKWSTTFKHAPSDFEKSGYAKAIQLARQKLEYAPGHEPSKPSTRKVFGR